MEGVGNGRRTASRRATIVTNLCIEAPCPRTYTRLKLRGKSVMLFFRAIVSVAASLLLLLQTALAEEKGRGPVLVELYTSMGCSSCPPADRYLTEVLKKRDDVIALAFHVDYWDYLGWRDSLAQPQFTMRQRRYARARGEPMVYTPQVVVQGRAFLVGSDRNAVRASIARSIGFESSTLPVLEVATLGTGRIKINSLARQPAAAGVGVNLLFQVSGRRHSCPHRTWRKRRQNHYLLQSGNDGSQARRLDGITDAVGEPACQLLQNGEGRGCAPVRQGLRADHLCRGSRVLGRTTCQRVGAMPGQPALPAFSFHPASERMKFQRLNPLMSPSCKEAANERRTWFGLRAQLVHREFRLGI